MSKNLRLHSFLVLLLVALSSIAVAKPNVHYQLSMPMPQTHYFEVAFKVDNFRGQQAEVQMPVWAPGSYLVREFAGHVEGVKVTAQNGQELTFRKKDKATWVVNTKGNHSFTFSYKVYAYELSVRTSFIDASHAYINGTSVFMYLKGHKDLPIKLAITPAEGWSTISTAMDAGKEKNTFTAKDYDELADSPIEIGNQTVFDFTASGVKHTVAMYGQSNYDIPSLQADMKKIVEQETAVFGGNPNEGSHYLFIVHNIENPGGGLEHKKSTTLQAERWQYGTDSGYKRFLSLVAHEYFHLWNVKRIRPEALGPFDYQHENYTSLLWVAEGVTTYYDDLLLLRSGAYTQEQYLSKLAATITRVENQPGSRVQSLASSSFDAWIKGYRTDENSYNSTISYYTKGVVVAALLDAIIIDGSKGKYKLDDVMKSLYQHYLKTGKGYDEALVKSTVEKYAKQNLDQFFADVIHGTKTIDYKKYFAAVGMNLTDAGLQAKKSPSLGVYFSNSGNDVVVRTVVRGGAGWNDGLNVHDEILAVDGVRMTMDNYKSVLSRMESGKAIDVLINRDGLLQTIKVTPQPMQTHQYKFSEMDKSTKQQEKLKAVWLAKND